MKHGEFVERDTGFGPVKLTQNTIDNFRKDHAVTLRLGHKSFQELFVYSLRSHPIGRMIFNS